MSILTRNLKLNNTVFDSSRLKIGEMMVSSLEFAVGPNQILFRTRNSIVSLSQPELIWDQSIAILGRKLLPGESIILTQE